MLCSQGFQQSGSREHVDIPIPHSLFPVPDEHGEGGLSMNMGKVAYHSI
ncbi:MAG: hypothetical protein RLP02_08180 [Coleofasciculus sp. C2-GNP5-27]